MITLRLGLALMLLALPAAIRAQSIELPKAPDGHVLDTANSLGDRRRSDLETELARISSAHRIDVHAVLWDRDLPADGDLAALAARLGETWSRQEQWVVVLQAPAAGGELAAAHGGFAGSDESGVEDAALAAGLARGRREWTAPDRLAASILNCAEEFIFLKHQRALETPQAQGTLPVPPADTGSAWDSTVVRLAAICALILLLGLLALAYSLRPRPSQSQERRFPDTRWKRRFGAPWSGGSDIGATIPPTES